MKKPVLALAVLLGVSILVNVLALSRLSDRPDSDAPSKSSGKSGGKTTVREETRFIESADSQSILKELRALREEITAARGGSAASTDGSRPLPANGGNDLPSILRDDPALASMVREQEALGKFWKDLQKVMGLQKSLGEQKYRELVIKLTAEFLQIAPDQVAGFQGAADLMLQEIGQATKDYQESSKNMKWDKDDQKGWQRQYQELYKRYNDQTKAAVSRMDSVLGTDGRHKQFRDQARTWAYYYHPKGQNWSWGEYQGWGAGSDGGDE